MLHNQLNVEESKMKPVLRWAGGKMWMLETIRSFVPDNYKRYHEPFVGGASIFLNVADNHPAFISDCNAELVAFYNQLKNNKAALVREIKKFTNSEKSYYKTRITRPSSDIEVAARFYFLNRTCFNGIYRVNRAGVFNVPFGYRNIDLIDNVSFDYLSHRLHDATITCADFEIALKAVKKDDLVFLDPPYTVAHNKNGFIEYNQKIFSWEDQERLAKCVNRIIEKKAFFIMTNAYHASIKRLYKGVGKHHEIERYSTISGRMDSRFPISEILITNCG